jgi:hypothetical protein
LAAPLDHLVERAPPAARADCEREIEDLLIKLLDDGYRFRGIFGVVDDPRIADRAARLLPAFWPDRYRFDETQPTRLRDRGIAELKNVWRRREGLPALEVPLSPETRSADPELARILERVRVEASSEPRADDLARLEAAGLGALPAVTECLAGLPGDHAGREALAALAHRLSNTVREVRLETGEWSPPARLRNAAALEGRSLTSLALVELLVAAVEALPAGGEVALVADRLGDGAGVTVTLRVEAAAASRDGAGVSRHSLVMAAGRLRGGSSGSGVRSRYDDAAGWKREHEAFEAALAVPHGDTFEIRVELEIR